MSKVVVAQSYPLQTARALVLAERYPPHLLWGADHLASVGWNVSLAAPPHGSRVAEFAARFGSKAGGLFEQAGALRSHDVLFAGRAQVVRAIAMARSSGAWRTPIVGIFHNDVPQRGRAAQAWVHGFDVALCLTRASYESLVHDHGRDPATTHVASWGPALGFSGYRQTGQNFILSSGKDNRDVPTLLKGLKNVAFPSRVYAPEGTTSSAPSVEVVTPGSGRPQLEYHEVLGDLQAAAIVAVPIADTNRLTGLTEINEALALGKPLVMTATPGHLDELDIERNGFGVYVRHGDSDHWAEILSALAADPERRHAMGRAARAFAEEHWNYRIFCETVDRALAQAIRH